MAAMRIWIAGYGGPPAAAIGAIPVWIATGDGSIADATEALIDAYGGPFGEATAVWIAGYGGPPPAAIGAIPIFIGGYAGAGGSVTPPVESSVWSAADAAATGMVLSNGGLTVTSPGGSKSIRSTIGKSSGKLYVEFLGVHTNGNEYQGVADSGFSPAGLVGSSGQSGGATWNANLVSGSFIANFTAGAVYPNAGDVVGIAVDFTLGQVWISIRGVWLGGGTPTFTKNLPMFSFVPATAGTLFPALSPTDAGDTWTLQATAASQKYAPPSGFSAWDSAAPSHSAEALAYLARTVGGDEGGNGANIATLIDGLVSDGVWAKLDCLYVLAQQNVIDARLNLIGASYTLPAGGTFTAYKGISAFPSLGLVTGFNASSSPNPHFTLNDATIGAWAYDDIVDGSTILGTSQGAEGSMISIYDPSLYVEITSRDFLSVPTPGTKGFFSGDRTSATVSSVYWNGVSKRNGTDQVQGATDSAPFYVGGAGESATGITTTLSAANVGASLGASGHLALYNRLKTYMDAVAPAHSPEALAYLARTVGGNEGGNATNIATLIDGLVSDGVWAKLDALYVLAQQNQSDAHLNLVSASYPIVAGATFTAYQGLSAFPSGGLSTGFNAASSPSPHFVQNSGSIGGWAYGVPGNNSCFLGSTTGTGETILLFYNNAIIGAINARALTAQTAAAGLFTVDRGSPSTLDFYLNGSNYLPSAASTSAAPDGYNISIGDLTSGSWQFTLTSLSAAFIGASLGAAGQLALYNRLRTYMTAVGVP